MRHFLASLFEMQRHMTALDRKRGAIALFSVVMFISAQGNAQAAAVDISVLPFQTNVVVPAGAPAGTIVARIPVDRVALMNACLNVSPCPLFGLRFFGSGGLTVTGVTTAPLSSPGLVARLISGGRPLTPGTKGPFQPESTEFQLIADGNPISSGYYGGTAGGDVFMFDMANASGGYNGNSVRLEFRVIVSKVSGTCSVNSQAVSIPPTSFKDFTGMGSTSPRKTKFNIQVTKCPPGYNKVGYSLDAVGGMVSGSPGVLPATADSTAAGVNIRVADATGSPVVFGASQPLAAYNPTTGGSYAIPLTAEYVQTGAAVSAGSISGAMTVSIDYR
ncbi:fimbrial protein [Burkholderia cenocepacia]|uniref:fimbrial protein n=1 Tax=Burkholderia cenocepacia TaxID=95486 RepID=UPI00285F9307|nr:fimbrial protein [Burkholderia cenocepacia]MDR8050294.1 fimbrial protein [Burkholderia cenocepacia]